MKEVKTADATREQLLRFAKVHLQLANIQPNTSEDKLRQMIKAATNEDVIYVQESAEHDPLPERKLEDKQRATPRRKAPVIDALRFAVKDPRFLVNIAIERSKWGKRAVFVAVNGTGILLPRGSNIEVPARYFYALENAVTNVVEDDEDGNRTETPSPAYNYSILRQPTQDEIDQWHDLMESLDGTQTKRAA